MKKILLGLISIIMAGQISFAQPVSDMAVIPMGITVQSVMRLNITKGGNIEFVFKSGTDVQAGIPAGGAYTTTYQTLGTVTASQNWDLNLDVDEGSFLADNGSGINLALAVVSLDADDVYVASGAEIVIGGAALTQNMVVIDANAANNLGDNIDFDIKWACGNIALSCTSITGALAGRYSANLILTLTPEP